MVMPMVVPGIGRVVVRPIMVRVMVVMVPVVVVMVSVVIVPIMAAVMAGMAYRHDGSPMQRGSMVRRSSVALAGRERDQENRRQT